MVYVINEDKKQDNIDKCTHKMDMASKSLAVAYDALTECYDDHSITSLEDINFGIEDLLSDLRGLKGQVENGDHHEHV